MKKLNNLEDLFHHHLKDIYSAETQLVDALSEMVKEAREKKLKKVFSDHLKETRQHVERLKEIGKTLGIKLTGETCKTMQGLIKEAESFISERAEDHVWDVGIIADAQCIEHYEISAYGTLVKFAKTLGEREIAKKLDQTLKEESNADKKLSDLAVDFINVKAKV